MPVGQQERVAAANKQVVKAMSNSDSGSWMYALSVLILTHDSAPNAHTDNDYNAISNRNECKSGSFTVNKVKMGAGSIDFYDTNANAALQEQIRAAYSKTGSAKTVNFR